MLLFAKKWRRAGSVGCSGRVRGETRGSCSPYYTRNLRCLYQRKIPCRGYKSAGAAAPPANGICSRRTRSGPLHRAGARLHEPELV